MNTASPISVSAQEMQEMMSKLVDLDDADLDLKDCDGKTALHYASMYAAIDGDADVAKSLIARGVDVNLQDNCGKTALHYACVSSNVELFTLITEAKGFNSIDLQDCTGRTALHTATIEGNDVIADKLVERAANLNIQDNCGKTALHYASASSNIELFNKFIGAGANVNIQCCAGRTPLHLLTRKVFDNSVTNLKEHGQKRKAPVPEEEEMDDQTQKRQRLEERAKENEEALRNALREISLLYREFGV